MDISFFQTLSDIESGKITANDARKIIHSKFDVVSKSVNKVGRPTEQKKRELIFVLFGVFTYGVEDKGEVREYGYRGKLAEWIADYFDYKNVRNVEGSRAIWNKFNKNNERFFDYHNHKIMLPFVNEQGSIIHSLSDMEHSTGIIDADILATIAPFVFRYFQEGT